MNMKFDEEMDNAAKIIQNKYRKKQNKRKEGQKNNDQARNPSNKKEKGKKS